MHALALTLAAAFTLCSGSPRITCVVDGDTFWLHGEKVRIADINAPETGRPGCAFEAELGEKAKLRLLALLNAGRFELERGSRDRDRYGRLLRTVTQRGRSLGAVLVAEGLAEPWRGRRSDWCAGRREASIVR
ncbi:MAG: thermonuclease family protein [Novosphingobium sp.]|nr:thermonuclease family protein [Novosphingobium sp.]